MIPMRADDVNTTMEGEDFVILHKISVFFPSGQNFDRPSIAVRGIVSDRNMSNNARYDIRSSLVFSLTFIGRNKRFPRNDTLCLFSRLLLILCRAIMTEVFDERDATINATYIKMKM